MRIAIVGAGSVGATAAYACILRGVAEELVIYDVDGAKAEAQALDLAHGVQFARMAAVRSTTDPKGCAGADIVVLAAGAKQKPGQTRMDLAGDNTRMCREVVPGVASVAPNALWLVVTNPVDVITKATLTVSGLDPARVVGTGTAAGYGSCWPNGAGWRCRTCMPTSSGSTATPRWRSGRAPPLVGSG